MTPEEHLSKAKEKVAIEASYNSFREIEPDLTEEYLIRSTLLALTSQHEELLKKCDHHYKIIEGDEINSFLAIILRKLDQDKLIVLRDALIQRTPLLEFKLQKL